MRPSWPKRATLNAMVADSIATQENEKNIFIYSFLYFGNKDKSAALRSAL